MLDTLHDPGYITLNFHEVISNMYEKNSNIMYSPTSITRAVLGKGHCDRVWGQTVTALYLCYPIMQPSNKRPVSNMLVFSSIVFPFALCLVALVHVEFELYAHRRMPQFLSQQREENIYSLGK